MTMLAAVNDKDSQEAPDKRRFYGIPAMDMHVNNDKAHISNSKLVGMPC